MTKVENLILLLNLFQHRRAVDVKTIMRECSIGERTAYRYIRSLEAAGFPVYFDAEMKGYCITNKTGVFSHLSPEESAAILFALDFLECNLSPGTFDPIHRARTKLNSQVSGMAQGFSAENLTTNPKLDKAPLIRELLIISLVKFAQQMKKGVRIHHQNGGNGDLLTVLKRPTLVYDREWKVKDEYIGTRPDSIPIRKVVDLEVT